MQSMNRQIVGNVTPDLDLWCPAAEDKEDREMEVEKDDEEE